MYFECMKNTNFKLKISKSSYFHLEIISITPNANLFKIINNKINILKIKCFEMNCKILVQYKF